MTEWDAGGYHRQSELQKWVADEHLRSLTLAGGEGVIDVGCGDGKITADIADRLPHGSALGVDPSADMIAFARKHFERSNLEFAPGDATRLGYTQAFDLVVSFETERKHWDFQTRQHFIDWARITFVEWTRMVPAADRDRFIDEVLDAYAQIGDDVGPNVFAFYQMEVELRRPAASA